MKRFHLPGWLVLLLRNPKSRLGGGILVFMVTIALIAPAFDDGSREQALVQYDLGQATMSIMITAADLGIGTGHSAVGDQDLARRLLGFPDDHLCAYLIALGHPAERPLAPLTKINRRPFDEVVHRGHW